ncbi:MAG: hypothetical protein HY077_07315 [Elusimicrobia bacterium]|nr:hypothetical protein [Elusimicrobiota bacterium]
MRRTIVAVLACAAAVYAMAAVDLVLRARSAYLEGMKYLEWEKDPPKKKAFFDSALGRKEATLKGELVKGSLNQAEYDERLELARFERDQRVAESSLKYAYVWFQTAVELFSPPESRWVALSRAKMAETKELWKRELQAKHIPYKDYMLE